MNNNTNQEYIELQPVTQQGPLQTVKQNIKDLRTHHPIATKTLLGFMGGMTAGIVGYTIYLMTQLDWSTNEASSSSSADYSHDNTERMGSIVVLTSGAAGSLLALTPDMYHVAVKCIKNTCPSFIRGKASDEETLSINNNSINDYNTSSLSNN